MRSPSDLRAFAACGFCVALGAPKRNKISFKKEGLPSCSDCFNCFRETFWELL